MTSIKNPEHFLNLVKIQKENPELFELQLDAIQKQTGSTREITMSNCKLFDKK